MERVKETVAFNMEQSTIIKGIAALCVVLAHYSLWLDKYVPYQDLLILYPFKQLGGIGVLIFFFLSGYGIYLSSCKQECSFKWLIKRVTNVWFPYIFMKLILETLYYLVNGLADFSILDSIKEILGLNLSDWFVVVILLQYMIFWLAWTLVPQRRIFFTFVLSIVMMVLFVICEMEARWYNGLLLFWFGLLVAKEQKVIIAFLNRNYILKTIVSAIGFVIMSILYVVCKGNLWAELIKICSGMILCIFIILICIQVNVTSSILRWLGNRSLYVYICGQLLHRKSQMEQFY